MKERGLGSAEELADFRRLVRDFFAKEVIPAHAQWETDGIVPRDVWRKAGRAGLLGIGLPSAHGGGGVDDYRFNAVLVEEQHRALATGPGFCVHNDVCAPYFAALCDEAQLARWVPGLASGELISAIAMTEPGAGSDLQAIRATAAPTATGWRVNGAKTFVTNGINADLVITAVRAHAGPGITLLVLERGMAGFERGRKLEKIGMHAQDTAEMSFDDVEVPRRNLIGEEGEGFRYLMRNLAQERLMIAIQAVAAAEGALELTLSYVKDRTAFGKAIGEFQHNTFVLAELATDVAVARVFIDRAIEDHVVGRLSPDVAAMAKLHCTEMQQRVLHRCVQLHGGYGLMREYDVGRAWADARVQTIYGGTSEMMKLIIGRSLGLRA